MAICGSGCWTVSEIIKLYDLPQRQNPRPKIYGLRPNNDPNGWVEFDHLDGMYSYCVAYSGEGEKLGVCHLGATLPLVRCDDGYRVTDIEDESEKAS